MNKGSVSADTSVSCATGDWFAVPYGVFPATRERASPEGRGQERGVHESFRIAIVSYPLPITYSFW